MFQNTPFPFVLCLLLLAGCQSEKIPPPAITVSTTGGGTVQVKNSHAVYHTDKSVVDLIVWKGFRNIDVWEQTSDPHGESMKLKDDRSLKWEYLNGSGIITVNETEYSLADGRLLLLSFDGDEVHVQQLDFDLSNLGSTGEDIEKSLIDLADTHDTIRDFVESAKAIP